MLADRARVLVLLLLASITTLVVVGGVVIVGHSNEHVDSEIAGLSREIHGVLSVERARPNSVDTLFVVMRDEVEWTGVVEESDWSKVCQITWDGPIRTAMWMQRSRGFARGPRWRVPRFGSSSGAGDGAAVGYDRGCSLIGSEVVGGSSRWVLCFASR
jgi:hypothetical protein